MSDTATTIGPGVYHDMPFSEYLAIDAASNTSLGYLTRSPSYCRYKRAVGSRDTDATRLGTITHTAILEPERFAQEYSVEPCLDTFGLNKDGSKSKSPRSSAKWKAERDRMESSGQTIVSAAELNKAMKMAESVHQNNRAKAAIKNAQATEVVLVWERDGILCKARIDVFAPERGYMADLKTTKDAQGFSPWEITKFRLYCQAAWYLDGAKRLDLGVDKFFIIPVANTAPYECPRVYSFIEDDIPLVAGQRENDSNFAIWRECARSNRWPDASDRLGVIEPAQITEGRSREILPELHS